MEFIMGFTIKYSKYIIQSYIIYYIAIQLSMCKYRLNISFKTRTALDQMSKGTSLNIM